MYSTVVQAALGVPPELEARVPPRRDDVHLVAEEEAHEGALRARARARVRARQCVGAGEGGDGDGEGAGVSALRRSH